MKIHVEVIESEHTGETVDEDGIKIEYFNVKLDIDMSTCNESWSRNLYANLKLRISIWNESDVEIESKPADLDLDIWGDFIEVAIREHFCMEIEA